MPQLVLEGLSVLGHVARHRLGADGEINASPLTERKREMGDLYPSEDVREEHVPALHLVLLQTALVNHLIALLLERNDDQSHKDVDEKKREDHKIHHVENGHLHPVPSARPHVLLCHVGGVLQDPGGGAELELI